MTPLALAIRDARRTVELWQSASPRSRARIRRHVAHALGCYPAWGAIHAEMVRRLLAEHDAARLAA